MDFWSTNKTALPHKLSSLGKVLEVWDRRSKLNKIEKKQVLEHRMRDLADKVHDDDILVELLDIQIGLDLEVDKEELY